MNSEYFTTEELVAATVRTMGDTQELTSSAVNVLYEMTWRQLLNKVTWVANGPNEDDWLELDDSVLESLADDNCTVCGSSGYLEGTDWVPYGYTNIPMMTVEPCDCTFEPFIRRKVRQTLGLDE